MVESAPPPPPQSTTSGDDLIHYFVRHPWQWVLKSAANPLMMEVLKESELPTMKLAAQRQQNGKDTNASTAQQTTVTPRRRARNKKPATPSTLRFELTDPETGEIKFAGHGTSSALDGLEDKDELVRTLQRCRCDHLHVCPPSVLINWDVTRDECLKIVGDSLPILPGNKSSETIAVLKEPIGSQGTGIFFVRSASQIHEIIEEHRKRAVGEPEFLDRLIAAKGRIPSWVLQAEVDPCLLIRGQRKFHIRSYVLALENLSLPDLQEVFIFNRHEVRIAGVPVSEDPQDRDRKAHITNGALSTTTERVLLNTVSELTSRDMQRKVEVFVAQSFGQHFVPDMARRVGYSASQGNGSSTGVNIRKFAIAGLDLMVTSDDRIFLLEVNVNPAAPPEHTTDTQFKEHLIGFMQDTMKLVMGKSVSNYASTKEILERNGLV